MSDVSKTAQEEFDEIYITSSEIGKTLGVCRATIVQARKRGMLPNPVLVNGAQIYIWKRAIVEPFLEAWKLNLAARRGELV